MAQHVLVLVLHLTTNDARFSDPQDLSELATVLDDGIRHTREVHSLDDLTLFRVDGKRNDALWRAIHQAVCHQIPTPP